MTDLNTLPPDFDPNALGAIAGAALIGLGIVGVVVLLYQPARTACGGFLGGGPWMKKVAGAMLEWAGKEIAAV